MGIEGKAQHQIFLILRVKIFVHHIFRAVDLSGICKGDETGKMIIAGHIPCEISKVILKLLPAGDQLHQEPYDILNHTHNIILLKIHRITSILAYSSSSSYS